MVLRLEATGSSLFSQSVEKDKGKKKVNHSAVINSIHDVKRKAVQTVQNQNTKVSKEQLEKEREFKTYKNCFEEIHIKNCLHKNPKGKGYVYDAVGSDLTFKQIKDKFNIEDGAFADQLKGKKTKGSWDDVKAETVLPNGVIIPSKYIGEAYEKAKGLAGELSDEEVAHNIKTLKGNNRLFVDKGSFLEKAHYRYIPFESETYEQAKNILGLQDGACHDDIYDSGRHITGDMDGIKIGESMKIPKQYGKHFNFSE